MADCISAVPCTAPNQLDVRYHPRCRLLSLAPLYVRCVSQRSPFYTHRFEVTRFKAKFSYGRYGLNVLCTSDEVSDQSGLV